MVRHIIIPAWCFGLISPALYLINPAAAQVDQQMTVAGGWIVRSGPRPGDHEIIRDRR